MHTSRTPALGLGVALFWLALSGTSSAEYVCGTASAGHHCYAITDWSEHPEYFGAYSDIPQLGLSCAGCDGFVDNEIWMIDDFTPECVRNPFRQCWVEAGYLADHGQNLPYLFWADFAPGGQFRLAFPAYAAISLNHFMIVKDGRTSPASFLLFIYNTSHSTLFSAVSLTSSGTPMKANRIVMGQELAGTMGAAAPATPFTRNIWAVVPLGPEYVFWYQPQRTPGFERQDVPPWERWTRPPATPGTEGGEFTTHCCR